MIKQNEFGWSSCLETLRKLVGALITARDWCTVIQETEKFDLPAIYLNGFNWTFEWNGNQVPVVLIASPLPIIIERTNKRSTKYGYHYFLSLLCLRQRVESIYLAQLKEYRKMLSLFCCSDDCYVSLFQCLFSCFCFVLIDHFLGAPLTGSHKGHWRGISNSWDMTTSSPFLFYSLAPRASQRAWSQATM